jgi:phospholipase/carboxylesterase
VELTLTHLHHPADIAAAEPWLLVLLHGIGSNERDLHGLAPAVPPDFHVLSLRAPYRLGPDAYGWFSFDVHPDGQRVIDTRQEAASRQAVALTARSAAEQLAVPARRVVIGGFSQGGIMALSILLTRPDLLTAAMVMHSRLLPETVPLIASEPDLLGRKLWVSHGTQDQVIPLSSAHDIRDRLRQLPIELSYAEFPGGHEIRPAELAAAMAWLQALAAAG